MSKKTFELQVKLEERNTDIRTLLDAFWNLATEAVRLNDDCVWADEHTTIHEALIDVAFEYDTEFAGILQKRLEDDSGLTREGLFEYKTCNN